MKPNLFRWATSELTQDAFLCWLIEWANPNYNGDLLNELAIRFLDVLCNIGKTQIIDLDIRKQYKSIDIVVVINKTKAILIEDKVHTRNHSNQLSRYANILNEEFSKENVSLIYLKTGDQSNYRNIESKGYKTFKRSHFLKLLNEGRKMGISNEIFIDFFNYLTDIENSVNSYKTLPIDKWHWDSWKGFYIELQKRLGQGEWDYVPQKNGGFLGFWWNWDYLDFKETGFDTYLQLEHEKFCFKICPYDIKLNHEIRDFYRYHLFQLAAKYNLELKKNGRCIVGKTKTMTVAKLASSYILTDSNNIIDIERTVYRIREIENLLKEIKLLIISFEHRL